MAVTEIAEISDINHDRVRFLTGLLGCNQVTQRDVMMTFVTTSVCQTITHYDIHTQCGFAQYKVIARTQYVSTDDTDGKITFKVIHTTSSVNLAYTDTLFHMFYSLV